jgi:hypothetical protein
VTNIYRAPTIAPRKIPPVVVTVPPENRANVDRESLRDLPLIVARILEARRDFYRNGQQPIDLVLSKDLREELLSVAKSGEIDTTTEPATAFGMNLICGNELPAATLRIR